MDDNNKSSAPETIEDAAKFYGYIVCECKFPKNDPGALQWSQSDRNWLRNAVGSWVSSNRLSFDPSISPTRKWPLPNKQEAGQYSNILKPFGLMRVSLTDRAAASPYPALPAGNWYVVPYSIQETSGGKVKFALGYWDARTKQIWIQQIWDSTSDFPQLGQMNSRAFYDPYRRWCHFFPYKESPWRVYSLWAGPVGLETRQYSSTNLDKPVSGAGMVFDQAGEDVPATCLFLPFTDNVFYSRKANASLTNWDVEIIRDDSNYQVIKLAKFNSQSGGGWINEMVEVDPLSLLDLGGASELTVCISSTGADTGAAWFGEGFLHFVSGLVGLDSSDNQEQCRGYGYNQHIVADYQGAVNHMLTGHTEIGRTIGFAVASIRPDGTSAFNTVQSFAASTTPDHLFGDDYYNNALTYMPSPGAAGGYDSGTGYWLEPCLNASVNAAYEYDRLFGSAFSYPAEEITGPINLPDFAFFNQVPILLPAARPNTNLCGSLKKRTADNWPEKTNACGGFTVAQVPGQPAVAWFVALVPRQITFGGVVTTLGGVTPMDKTSVRVCVDCVPLYLGSGGYSNTPAGGGTFIRMVHKIQPYFVPYQGSLWQTLLYQMDASGALSDPVDISQKLDVSYNQGGAHDLTRTAENIELADNVWKILLFPEKDCAVLLRDLHQDGSAGEGNPSPVLEIRRFSDPSNVLSRVQLSSPDLVTSYLPGRDDPYGNSVLVGDRVFDPYYLGPPLMKACSRQTELGRC